MVSLKIIVALVFAVLAVFIILGIYFKKKNSKSNFPSSSSSGGRFGGSGTQKAASMGDVEEIIKNSEKLGEVLNAGKNYKDLYKNILLNKELVLKIRQAKSNREVESLLSAWLKGNYAEDYKRIGKRRKQRKRKNLTPKTKSAGTLNKVKEDPKKSEKKTFASLLNEEDKLTLDEVEKFLESKDIEKLIDLIKMLKDDQIDRLMGFYSANEANDEFSRILKQSKAPQDATALLRLEAINILNSEYERLKGLVAEARRKGKDVREESLQLLSVPQKIKMFQATFDKKDFYRVRDLMLSLENNINIKLKTKDNKV